jgi:hypothetical protein
MSVSLLFLDIERSKIPIYRRLIMDAGYFLFQTGSLLFQVNHTISPVISQEEFSI